ncbi:hypothetical protein [Saccharothrix stipae]
MTNVVPPSEQYAELDRWCELLAQLCAAWGSTAEQGRTTPPQTSPASREDVLLTARHADWQAHDASNTGRDAAVLTDAAAQHLLGLRSLAVDRAVTLPLWPLARHVAEYAAQAGWLLAPDITADQRVARRWLLKLVNFHRYRQTLGSMTATKKDLRTAKNLRAQVEQELRHRFPDAGDLGWTLEQHPNGPPWNIAGQHVPSLGELVRAFVKVHGFHQARGIYDMLSLQSHPNLDVVVARHVERVVHEDFVQYTFRIDVPQAIRVLRTAALLFYRAAMVVTSYFELDPARLNAWYDSLPGRPGRTGRAGTRQRTPEVGVRTD